MKKTLKQLTKENIEEWWLKACLDGRKDLVETLMETDEFKDLVSRCPIYLEDGFLKACCSGNVELVQFFEGKIVGQESSEETDEDDEEPISGELLQDGFEIACKHNQLELVKDFIENRDSEPYEGDEETIMTSNHGLDLK